MWCQGFTMKDYKLFFSRKFQITLSKSISSIIVQICKNVQSILCLVFGMLRRPGITSSELVVIVGPLGAGGRPRGSVAHPEAGPHAGRGLLIVLDGVAESLGHVVRGLRSISF